MQATDSAANPIANIRGGKLAVYYTEDYTPAKGTKFDFITTPGGANGAFNPANMTITNSTWKVNGDSPELTFGVQNTPNPNQSPVNFSLVVQTVLPSKSQVPGINGYAYVDNNAATVSYDPTIDEPFSGVTVQLWSSYDNGDPPALYAETTTATDGLYSFTGMPDGAYFVKVLAPSGDWHFNSAPFHDLVDVNGYGNPIGYSRPRIRTPTATAPIGW